MSGKKREYSNLDSVFNRLQVSSSASVGGGADNVTSENGASHQPVRITESTSMSIGERLKRKRRKQTTKCIVRKAKLVLPKTFTTTATKKRRGAANVSNNSKNSQHKDEDEVDTDHDDDDVFLDSNDSDDFIAERPGTPASCSAQYLQQTSVSHSSIADPSSSSADSSNPDELASYFEQMLFIPKPMSLMAQMMYA